MYTSEAIKEAMMKEKQTKLNYYDRKLNELARKIEKAEFACNDIEKLYYTNQLKFYLDKKAALI